MEPEPKGSGNKLSISGNRVPWAVRPIQSNRARRPISLATQAAPNEPSTGTWQADDDDPFAG